MTKFNRGVRFMPPKAHEIIIAGRSQEKQIEDVMKEGMYLTPAVLRNSIIGGLGIRRRSKTSENMIVFGCACFGTALEIISYFRLLDRLDVDFDFLQKEYCCGAPIMGYALREGIDRTEADRASKEFVAMNIAQARERGAKKMYYCCPWCVYVAKRFFPNEDIAQLYYLDLVVEALEKKNIQIEPTRIGYFEGGHHRRYQYDPDDVAGFDWSSYRKLLGAIQGVEIVDLPKFCCVMYDNLIFERAQKEKVNTIVTPCMTCYGRLSRKKPAGIQAKSLSDFLLESISNKPVG